MLAWFYFQWIRSRSIISWAPFLAQITLTFPLAVSVYYSSFEIQIKSVYSKNSILNLSSWWLCQLSTSRWYDKALFMQRVCMCSCVQVPMYGTRGQPQESNALFIQKGISLMWGLQIVQYWLTCRPQRSSVSNSPALRLQTCVTVPTFQKINMDFRNRLRSSYFRTSLARLSPQPFYLSAVNHLHWIIQAHK